MKFCYILTVGLTLLFQFQHGASFRVQAKLCKPAHDRMKASRKYLYRHEEGDEIKNMDDLSLKMIPILAASFPGLAFAGDVANVGIVRPFLDIFFGFLSFLFICRTVISWFPATDLNKLPYSIVAWPTEPLLKPVRGLIPLQFGVDISSIVWVMLLNFLREILTGQQGILTLLEKS